MRRRDCFKLLGAAAALMLMWPLRAHAESGGTYRIGLLETASGGLYRANFNALRGLRRRGPVAGQNPILIYRSADTGAERLPALAAELLHLGVDLIVTPGTPAAEAAKDAAAKIPGVMAALGAPLALGVVASPARRAGYVIGVSALAVEPTGKRVELPSVGPTVFIENMGNPLSEQERESRSAGYRDLDYRVEGRIDTILKGAASEALALEQPIKLETVDLKTAEALGIGPRRLIALADEVIE